MSISEMEDDVFEGVLGFGLDGEDIAEAVDVMPPEYLILCSLDSVEKRLQRDARKAFSPNPFYTRC